MILLRVLAGYAVLVIATIIFDKADPYGFGSDWLLYLVAGPLIFVATAVCLTLIAGLGAFALGLVP